MNRLPSTLLWTAGIISVVIVYGYRLGHPATPYFDEVHTANFFTSLTVDGEYNYHMSRHPPLWRLFAFPFVSLFGTVPIAYRIVPFAAHMGVISMTFLMARRMSGDTRTAIFVVAILLFDCLSFTQARVGMVNSLMLFFSLAAVYIFLKGLEAKNGIDYRRLKCSSFLWALAVSTKLVAINLVFFFAPLLLMRVRKNPHELRRIVATYLIYFLLLPIGWTVGLYLLVPYIAQPDIANAWAPLLTNLSHHLDTRPTHNFASRWWTWSLILKPTLFYVKTHQWTSPSGTCEAIFAMGNPVIFWTLPLSFGNSLWEMIKKGSKVHGIILLGLLSQWMTFALASRLQFFHYFYLAMPFAAMATGFWLAKMYRWGTWGRIFVAVYLAATVVMFVYWYPLLTGLTISRTYFYHHMWLPGWI